MWELLFGQRSIECKLNRIDERIGTLMGAFEDFVTAQGAHNDAVSASLDAIAADIAGLNALIQALKGAALEAKAAALDALTPPTP